MLAVGLIACGDESTPEEQVRATIDGMAEAVEARSVQRSADYLHDDYSDQWHPNRRAAVQSLFGYLRGHSDIHLFTLVRSIDVSEPGDSATAIVFVATAGVPVESLDALVSIKADLYRFDIEVVPADEHWQVAKARWARADISDLTGID